MQGTRHHILLATNTASQSARHRAYLGNCGIAVRCVYTGCDIVSTLAHENYDMLFMDIDLPDGDAAWVLEQINTPGFSSEFSGPILVAAPPGPPGGLEEPSGMQDAAAPDTRLKIIRQHAFTVSAPLSTQQLHQTILTLLEHIPEATKGAMTMRNDFCLPSSLAGAPLTEEEIYEILPPIAPERRGGRIDATTSDFGGFIGTSPTMLSLYEQIQSAARSMAPVFITGESGTGKEVCAQAIHKHSQRAEKPFIPLNCAAIPRDLLESELFGHVRGAFTGALYDRDGAATLADGGTLFLDEIGDMDPNMQTKLLRFLQDGTFQRVGGNTLETVRARIICATNRDPMADIRSGRLREDLFYRLHVLPIVMPPLRLRGEDVLDIAQTLLLRYAAEEDKRFKGFAEDAETILRTYQWPGNIRQLQNIIRHAIVMHDGLVVTARMLPVQMFHPKMPGAVAAAQDPVAQDNAPNNMPNNIKGGSVALGHLDGSLSRMEKHSSSSGPGAKPGPNDQPNPILPLHEMERRAIERAVQACSGNIPRAAALLQVSPSTIYRKKAQWDDVGHDTGDGPAQNPAQNRAGHTGSDPNQPG